MAIRNGQVKRGDHYSLHGEKELRTLRKRVRKAIGLDWRGEDFGDNQIDRGGTEKGYKTSKIISKTTGEKKLYSLSI